MVLLGGLAQALARDVHWDPSQGRVQQSKCWSRQIFRRAGICFPGIGLHILLIEGPGGYPGFQGNFFHYMGL